MFGPNRQEHEAALQQVAALQRQVQELQDSRESVNAWARRCEEENGQKDTQIKQQREESVALSIQLDHAREELEALRSNLARITPSQTPFLTFGLWRIRIGRIDEITADDEGYVAAVNKTTMASVNPSPAPRVKMKVDDLERLIAVHHHRDPS